MATTDKYKVTIGLEIHAELKTKTKMFCNSVNDPSPATPPNTNVCPVCMAHPGSLPVLNKKAIEHVIKVGLSMGSEIANFTEWDRKNYFYPDIPKAYQITQYKYPIVAGGKLNGVDITRIHLEEDTGTNKHHKGHSLVDFNRAGVPLMELVTEPVIHTAEDAGAFGRELQLLLRTLGVSDANMEMGEMRVELNLSVSDTNKFGTKVEVKNINSFKAVEKAARFEIARHTKFLEEGRGDEIVQETRGWDDNKGETFSQRMKENSEDYRYFPEPDLPKLYLHDMFDLDSIKSSLPELPNEKRARYEKDYGIKEEDIETFVTDKEFGNFFESLVEKIPDKDKIKKATNYITTDIVGLKANTEDFKMPDVEIFVRLMDMVFENKITSRVAKDILALIVSGEVDDPMAYAEKEGLLQESNEDALKDMVQAVIDANEKVVEDYRGGNENSLKFLIGQVMKESKGSANPQVANKLLKDLIK